MTKEDNTKQVSVESLSVIAKMSNGSYHQVLIKQDNKETYNTILEVIRQLNGDNILQIVEDELFGIKLIKPTQKQ